MEGEPTPLLSGHDSSSYIFPPTLGSNYSLQPPSLLHQQSPQESQTAPEIDWVSLLSGQNCFGDPKKLATHSSAALTTAGNGSEELEKTGKDKGKVSRMKKVTQPRFAFRTRSADDILDDGYRWRKYGQKAVKNSAHPRSYYRCTHHTCNVKKQVQRLSKDTSIVVTTYEGIHNHPCEKLMQALGPLLKQLQFFPTF